MFSPGNVLVSLSTHRRSACIASRSRLRGAGGGFKVGFNPFSRLWQSRGGLPGLRALSEDTVGKLSEDAVGKLSSQKHDTGSEQELWVQRKVSVIPNRKRYGSICGMIETAVKEMEQYSLGLAHIQVQTTGFAIGVMDLQGLEVGTDPLGTTTLSVQLSQGKMSVGDNKGVFLISTEDSKQEGTRPKACEMLVTLQGERTLETAQPASHVIGTPRRGDEFSSERAKAIDQALNVLGEDPMEVLKTEFDGSAARRAYLTFVNPRPGKVSGKVETLEEAATRSARQVSFLLREHRAMLAEFLRNADAARAEQEALGLVPHPLILVLDNVRSAENVGSIFRTAETARLQEIVTCGITPHPPHTKLKKTALSAVEYVDTRHFESTVAAVNALKDEGVFVFGMETTSRSVSYTRVDYPKPCALVLGNELTGIDTQVMDLCDELIEIPMFGLKNSLNVASACPVVIFETLRKWDLL